MFAKRSTSTTASDADGAVAAGGRGVLRELVLPAALFFVGMMALYVWLLNADFSTAPEFIYSQF